MLGGGRAKRVQRNAYESQFYLLLVVGPWASHLASLCLDFLICEVAIRMANLWVGGFENEELGLAFPSVCPTVPAL